MRVAAMLTLLLAGCLTTPPISPSDGPASASDAPEVAPIAMRPPEPEVTPLEASCGVEVLRPNARMAAFLSQEPAALADEVLAFVGDRPRESATQTQATYTQATEAGHLWVYGYKPHESARLRYGSPDWLTDEASTPRQQVEDLLVALGFEPAPTMHWSGNNRTMSQFVDGHEIWGTRTTVSLRPDSSSLTLGNLYRIAEDTVILDEQVAAAEARTLAQCVITGLGDDPAAWKFPDHLGDDHPDSLTVVDGRMAFGISPHREGAECGDPDSSVAVAVDAVTGAPVSAEVYAMYCVAPA